MDERWIDVLSPDFERMACSNSIGQLFVTFLETKKEGDGNFILIE